MHRGKNQNLALHSILLKTLWTNSVIKWAYWHVYGYLIPYVLHTVIYLSYVLQNYLQAWENETLWRNKTRPPCTVWLWSVNSAKVLIQPILKPVNSHHRNQGFGLVQEREVWEGLNRPTSPCRSDMTASSLTQMTLQSKVRVSQGPNNLLSTLKDLLQAHRGLTFLWSTWLSEDDASGSSLQEPQLWAQPQELIPGDVPLPSPAGAPGQPWAWKDLVPAVMSTHQTQA